MKSFLTTKSYFSRFETESAKLIIINNFVKRKEIKNADKLIAKLENLKKNFESKSNEFKSNKRSLLINIKRQRSNSK